MLSDLAYLWSRQGHQSELLVHVAPEVVQSKGGHEQENVDPLEVVVVETVGEEDDQHEEYGHEEAEPREEEAPPPGSDPVTGQAVDHGGHHGIEDDSSSSNENNILWRTHKSLGDGKDDHPNTEGHQEDVDEEAAAEDTESPPDNSGALADADIITEKVTVKKDEYHEKLNLPE